MSLLPCDESGYAIPAADIMSDWFTEHGDDPNEGAPETWPDDYDSIRIALGPALFPQESIDPFDPLPPDEVDEIPF
jgi:hypothetical protein